MEKQKERQVELVSPEKLEKALGLLEELDGIDTVPLERRFGATIAGRRRKRRRMAIARSCAAVLVPLLVLGAFVWFAGRDSSENIITRIAENVMLTLPDGSQIFMEEIADDAVVAEIDNVIIQRAAGSLIYHQLDETSASQARALYNTLEVPCGNQFDIMLGDGTRVWLNSDSRLRFPSSFTDGERRVYVEGEAYFEVARDTEKPFVVEAPGQTLTVLGTKFNIYAYSDDTTVHTTLIEGSVSVKSLKNDIETLLVPNQQAILDVAAGEFSLRTVNPKELIAWKNGAFVFEGNTMEQIMQKLARWYDVEYSFENDRARSLVSKGSIPIQDDVTTILDILETTGPVRLEIKGNHIKVSMKK